jgi:hypothetical protein
MGDRASVILKGGNTSFFPEVDQISPVLCQHWGGSEFHESVRKFILEQYSLDHSKDGGSPENRLEPERLFVRLVCALGEGGYICREREEVDDSDNGCLYVTLDQTPKFEIVR